MFSWDILRCRHKGITVLFSSGIFATCAPFTSANTLPRSVLCRWVLLPPRVLLALQDGGVCGAGDGSSNRVTGSGGAFTEPLLWCGPSEQKRKPRYLLCHLSTNVGNRGNAAVVSHGRGGRLKPPEARAVPGAMSPPFAGPAARAAERRTAKPAASPPGCLGLAGC